MWAPRVAAAATRIRQTAAMRHRLLVVLAALLLVALAACGTDVDDATGGSAPSSTTPGA